MGESHRSDGAGARRLNLALAATALLALASAALDPEPARRAAVVIAAAIAVGLAQRVHARVVRDLEALASARLADGDALPPLASEPARRVAARIEDARDAWAARARALEQQRDAVAEHLTRAERPRDPVADARRERLARLAGVDARLVVGRDRAEARLVDLTPDLAALAVRPEVARRLVPGMPVAVRISLGDEVFEPAGAVAIAPSRADADGLVEWLVRFGSPHAPSPTSVLWQTVAMRHAERVRPPPDVPATATLLAPFGDVPAKVADLSADGVGLLVSLDPAHLGDLDRALVARLTFPTLGKMAILSAELCNVTPAGAAVRLGLRFSGDEAADRARVAEWLAACAAAPGSA